MTAPSSAIPPAIVEALKEFASAVHHDPYATHHPNAETVAAHAKLVTAIADALQEAQQNAAHAGVYAAFDALRPEERLLKLEAALVNVISASSAQRAREIARAALRREPPR